MLLRFFSSQAPLISSSFRVLSNGYDNFTRRRSYALRAVEKEPQFEIDRERARESLQKLDEQLKALSQKQITPKKRVSPSSLELNLERDLITGLRITKGMPEISGSFLTYSAVALLILTFFNNILFSILTQPSAEPKEAALPTVNRGPSNEVVVQQAPPLVDQE
ncbi:uncharacterized protein LOC143847158 [Tasmannia lanceolata]|uniref:uncharacterized protein LOC143847158 n=1 Tax=Tasmannia lanceolata TaxID=3420 RepID=UPI00406300CB